MTLAELCQQASSTLNDLAAAKKHQHQRVVLRERASEWAKIRAQWNSAIHEAGWVKVSPDSVPECVRLRASIRNDARESAKRLADLQDVARLAADPVWTRLLQSTSKGTDALRAAAQVAWRSLVESTEQPSSPAALQSKVAKSARNREVLGRYERHYAIYQSLASLPGPRTENDASALQSAVSACQGAVRELQYLEDVPPAVQEFFRAVDARTATLSSLSPDVLQWLHDHDQLHEYVVRSSRA